jgi:hypothetical protein
MSHSADGLIGTTTHQNLNLQQPPIHGTPQYILVYGGPPYYPPPPYQQPYPIPSPPISGPPWRARIFYLVLETPLYLLTP